MQERKMIRTGKPMDLLLLNDSVHWGEMRAQCIAIVIISRWVKEYEGM